MPLQMIPVKKSEPESHFTQITELQNPKQSVQINFHHVDISFIVSYDKLGSKLVYHHNPYIKSQVHIAHIIDDSEMKQCNITFS